MAIYTSIIKKDDVKTIEKRKRLLAAFLNNVSSLSRLKDDHIFKLFLEDSVEWSEEVLKMSDLHSNSNIISPSQTGRFEQLQSKYREIIESRVVEFDCLFKQYKEAIGTLENTERNKIKQIQGKRPLYLIIGIYEALCELGCACNSFSLEYDNAEQLSSSLAQSGEIVDADAAVLHECITASESYCDRLHEQFQFCAEAGRLITFVALSAIKCSEVMKAQSAKRNQIATLGQSGLNHDAIVAQLTDLDREKSALENEQNRILTIALEELETLKHNCLSSISDVVKYGICAMMDYHGKNRNLYSKK